MAKRLVNFNLPLPALKTSAMRSVLGIRNLEDLVARCLVSDTLYGGTYLVSDSHPLSVNQMMKLISTALKKRLHLVAIPSWLVSLLQLLPIIKNCSLLKISYSGVVDSREICALLSWHPPYSTEAEIEYAVTSND